jgi:glycosyltransferase involved in cell wall biosynthesis
MKKIAIVTSLIGAYDSKLLEINFDRTKYDFICFTNNKKLRSKTWDLRIVEPIMSNNNAKSSYYYKWCLHKVLDHDLYDYCVWVDSSVWEFNVIKFEEYLDKFIKMEDCSLYIEKHPSRNTLRDELEANRRLTKDDDSKMVNQVNRYFKEGFRDDRDCIMVETGFSFRRFKDPDLIKMSELLWEEMMPENSTKRDQLLFDYCVWKTNFKHKIKLFSFEQKSEILKFSDHPHKPFYTEKILLCGPWQGEIGFELFAWQGYLRYISQTEAFDKIVVGCEPESKFLYDDFADQVIMTPVVGTKSGCLLNGKEPYFKMQNTQDKDIKLVRPSMSLCYNILSNLDKQEFIDFDFPEEFRKKYFNLNFDEIKEAFKNKNIPNYLRKQLNLPNKNNFKIVVVGGMAEKYIDKCLQSIINQTNINWECQVVLTPTKDKTFEIAKKYESEKLKVCKTEKDWFVIKNYQKGVELLNPNDDDIIISIDADDWLAHNDVLNIVDKYYMENKDLLITCGSWQTFPEHTKIPSNCISYNEKDFQKGIRKTLFRGTHLRTLKYKVFKSIPESEFTHSKTGEIYKAAGDAAIMIPAIESVGLERYKFIPEILYIYNRETDFNEDKEKQKISIDVTMDIAKKPNINVKNFDKYKCISLYDKTFPHGKLVGNFTFKNFDSNIIWDRINLQRECIFFTDFTFKEVDNFNNPEKYCMLVEPEVIFPEIYEQIKSINHKFKYVFTHSEKLLNLNQNYKMYPYGGCWIETCYQKIYDKSKDISIVVSQQNRTLGHKLRHEIVNKFRNYFDLFGKGYNPVDTKLETLKNYKFQIVVENCQTKYYFSEKLIDCLVCGVVPIYWGNWNLNEFGFDVSGILEFNTLDELQVILDDINCGDLKYENFQKQINHNFENAKKYIVTENFIYDNYFKNLEV